MTEATFENSPAPSKRRTATFVLLLASILFSLLVLEGGLRLLLPPLDSREMTIPDEEIGKILRPGYKGESLGVQVEINSHGLRSPEVSLEKPEGTFRVLVLGDSWTFGVGVPQDRTYSAQLEDLLKERNPESLIEVINAGVSGYETYNEAVYFRRSGSKLNPDLVVIGYYPVNDVHDKRSRFEKRAQEKADHPIWYAIRRFPSEHLYTYQYLDFVRSRVKRSYREWRYSRPILDAGPEELDDRYDVEWTSLYRDDFEGWKVVKESLADIAKVAGEIDCKVLLAVFPDLRSLAHYRTSLRDKFFPMLEEVAREHGIEVVDVATGFYPFEGSEEKISLGETKGSTHPNGEGCRLIAESIAAAIEERGLLERRSPETHFPGNQPPP